MSHKGNDEYYETMREADDGRERHEVPYQPKLKWWQTQDRDQNWIDKQLEKENVS